RLPYGPDFQPVREFNYEEGADGRDHDKYLWMNAAWAYAARVTHAFARHGWFARTCGVEGGGKVEGLPALRSASGDGDRVVKGPTEVAITGDRELELSNLGFLPLLHCKDTDHAAFLGAHSCQKPRKFLGPNAEDANTSAELSSRFNYLLCGARFAHFVKVLA